MTTAAKASTRREYGVGLAFGAVGVTIACVFGIAIYLAVVAGVCAGVALAKGTR